MQKSSLRMTIVSFQNSYVDTTWFENLCHMKIYNINLLKINDQVRFLCRGEAFVYRKIVEFSLYVVNQFFSNLTFV